MLRKLILAAGVALALFAPAYAEDPQTFKTEDSATAFCKVGNVVWFNPASKIYFAAGALILLATIGRTNAESFLDGNKLYEKCRSESALCIGYVEGIVDAAVEAAAFSQYVQGGAGGFKETIGSFRWCSPKGLTAGQ